MTDPDPCPFCGGARPHVLDNTVECAYCDAEGPYSVSSKEAVAAWNRRPVVEQARRDGIAWALKRLREWADAHASIICAAAARGAARAIEHEASGGCPCNGAGHRVEGADTRRVWYRECDGDPSLSSREEWEANGE